jgi:acetyl esterase
MASDGGLSLKYRVFGWVASLGGGRAERQTAAEARAAMRRTVAGPSLVMGRPPAMASIVHMELGGVRVRRYVPQGVARGTLVFFHGGGWVVGDLDTHDGMARALAAATGRTTVAVDYRLAPEHPYPAALDDCQAVTAALAADPQSGPIVVAGDSAGGGLAAVVAQRLGTAICAQLLIYPVVDCAEEAPSYRRFAAGPVLTAAAMRHYRATYVPDPDQRRDPGCSPLRAPDVAQLAPAYVLLASCDVLRDEGRSYATRLQQSGVAVRCDEVQGVFHGFLNLLGTTEAQAAVVRMAAWLAPYWQG